LYSASHLLKNGIPIEPIKPRIRIENPINVFFRPIDIIPCPDLIASTIRAVPQPREKIRHAIDINQRILNNHGYHIQE